MRLIGRHALWWAMQVAFFNTKPYDELHFSEECTDGAHDLIFHDFKLNPDSAKLAAGSGVVCAFVNDHLNPAIIEVLSEVSVRVLAMRCAGFNNLNLEATEASGLKVVPVPAHSPYAVAEHTLELLLALNRRLYRAYNRVREGNFSLQGLVGFDIHGLTVDIIGTGTIGVEVVRLFDGFGCKVLCCDVKENPRAVEFGAEYVDLDTLLPQVDIISLHGPLFESPHHTIDAVAIAKMKHGVTLLNTSCGALVDTAAVIDGLKSGQIGNLGIDVHEEEDNMFFEDQSGEVMQDDVFARLLTFPNVMVTEHQAFFTSNALIQIACTTLENLTEVEQTGACANEVKVAQ